MKKIIFSIIATIVFTASIQAQCKCGTTTTESRWDGIGFRIGDGELKKYKCGYQFTVKTTQAIKFASGGYLCIGDAATCTATYSGSVYRGTVRQRLITPFDFTSEVIQFPTPGSYKLVLEASCNKTKCNQCVYYFTVL
jgi:hypothetical protein